ncbi:MAG: tyrosine-protein phosphatase [Thermoleophilaceae bacterium]|nr:tyrosine-protein phosphatase [Thermoleophilaceae bacterium]
MRHLDWDGCFNVRDLGGLRAVDGRATRWGAVVRGDSPDRLTAAGWSALRGHGIRTIIDLRNEDERHLDRERPAGLTTVLLPLDGREDARFWDRWARGPQFATPLYYRPHLDRFPERSARVVAAIAGAEPGGVLVHCVGGRDRTGQIAMLLLALLGMPPQAIARDYALSRERLTVRYAALGEEDQGPTLADYLSGHGTTAEGAILSTLAEVDVQECLRAGGLRDADIASLRDRVLEP